MTAKIRIEPLSALPSIRAALSELLVETVASGGSVSFMHPLSIEAADTFWRDSLATPIDNRKRSTCSRNSILRFRTALRALR